MGLFDTVNWEKMFSIGLTVGIPVLLIALWGKIRDAMIRFLYFLEDHTSGYTKVRDRMIG